MRIAKQLDHDQIIAGSKMNACQREQPFAYIRILNQKIMVFQPSIQYFWMYATSIETSYLRAFANDHRCFWYRLNQLIHFCRKLYFHRLQVSADAVTVFRANQLHQVSC
ncbi:MAG: hypothetical protein KBD00_03330 [Candidatus Peribacteraceae bacterium]|nr:hypothetical protein [Candidatus Peribacteraceae bacterium]